ncbi:MAG TPA: phosphatase PAP2 family protein [Ignavibacteriaceae bacterium]|nr:phosphatase PAP2 family protein [Ignavibacteriaceae bacterium]
MTAKLREKILNNKANLIILLYAVLMAIAGIFDLQISQSLVNKNSGWAKVIEDYGELPGIITILTAIFIYYKKKKHSSNVRTVSYSFILTYSAFMLFSYIGNVLLKPLVNSFHPVIIFASVLTLTSVVLVKKLKINFSETAFDFSKVVLLMGIFGYVLFVQPLKIFWGRVRFRDLDVLFSNFTNWYVPNGVTGNESFPSGHTAMGFILISFFVLFRNKNFVARFGVYSFVLTWAIAVAASRVVTGAHFLSDVIVGSMGMLFVYLYFSKPERTKNV